MAGKKVPQKRKPDPFLDPTALRMVEDLRSFDLSCAEKDAVREILRDRLFDLGPSPVKPGVVPDWMRLTYMAFRKTAIKARANYYRVPRTLGEMDSEPEVPNTYGNSCSAVCAVLHTRLSSSHWDHCGSTRLLGLPCAVTEPYASCDDADFRAAMQALTDDFSIPGLWVIVPHSHHYPESCRVVRAVLFDPGMKYDVIRRERSSRDPA